LLVVSIFLTIVGVGVAVAPESVFLALHTSATADAFFGGAMPDDAAAMRAFLLGPLGGTIAGYFLMQTFILMVPFRRRERWAWHAILWALVLWFVVDSTMSIYQGALFNVLLVNVWTVVLVGLPLAMTYRAFRGRRIAA